MTFLAVRRWLGWSAGKLLVLDIGGGSLEIASGIDENPEATISLPLGAARLTREFLNGDPYSAKGIKALEKHAEEVLKDSMPNSLRSHDADHFVATSKTFRTLARICAQWYGDNPKFIERKSLNSAMPRLIEMTNKSRAELPGVSANRAQQIVAGGIVALAVMDRLDVDEAEICPWALREGILLRRLDWLSD
jgi:exopolyphosphatase/guanosine-5'-triphosphate,3'-diphosphate pyrophosphatase